MVHAVIPAHMKFDPKWEAFCQHYAAHGNGLRAAQQAGLAKTAAYRLLDDIRVQQRIQAIHAEQFRSVGITAMKVKEELARVAFASAADLYDEEGNLIAIHDLPDAVASTITSVEVDVQKKLTKGEDGGPVVEEVVTKKIKRADKMAALALLARHFKIVGAEDDGVNQLATALADRLNRAKRRLGEPEDLPHVEQVLPEAEDAVIIEQPGEPAEDELWRP